MNQQTHRRRRSLSHLILLTGFFLVTTAGFVRMGNSIANWYWLNFAGVQPGPLYLAITGGLWGLAGLLALIWLLFHLPGSRQVGTGAALFFVITYWLDRLLIRDQATSIQNTGFVFLLTLFLLFFVLMVLRPWIGIRITKGL